MKKFFSSVKNFTANLYLSLKYNFRGGMWSATALIIIVVITALIPFATAKVSANVIDSLIESIKTGFSDKNTIIFYALLWAFMEGFNGIVSLIRQFITTFHNYKVKILLEYEVLKKFAQIDIGRYEQPSFQNLMERAFGSRNYWPLQQLGDNFMRNFLWSVVEIVTASLIIGFFDWRIYLLIVVTTLPRFINDLIYGQKEWNIWAKNEGEDQRKYYNFRQHLRTKIDRSELLLYQGFHKLLEKIKAIFDQTANDLVKNEKNKLWISLGTELVSTVGFGIAIYLVVTQVLDASVGVGQMTFIVASIGRLSGAIIAGLEDISRMYDLNRYVTDIRAVLNTEPLIQTPGPKELVLFEPPEIKFENVSFTYPTQTEQVLKNINFTIYPGQKIGLVGNNGAGKSTFIKLLCRIYDPTEGKITVNGIDLKNVKPEIWQSYLSVLMQDFASYEFTVKEVIAMSQTSAPYDHERVLWSAKSSQAYKFIEEWEKQYDEQLGVEFKGKEPSKGQRQKLALARAFYRKAPIMLLDEPTAAVDAESEIEIFKELDRLPKSITGIFISHDFSTIRRADRILVMETGSVTEDGTHEELVALKGTYERLFNEQVRSLVEEKIQG